jgi:hypothetical protein
MYDSTTVRHEMWGLHEVNAIWQADSRRGACTAFFPCCERKKTLGAANKMEVRFLTDARQRMQGSDQKGVEPANHSVSGDA